MSIFDKVMNIMSGSNISINGNIVGGKSITIRNGQVIIDGVDHTPDLKNITIVVNGNVEQIQVEACNYIEVNGSVDEVSTTSGDIKIGGNVMGDARTVSGDVELNDCMGSVSSTSGDIEANTINGSVKTLSGDIKYKKA